MKDFWSKVEKNCDNNCWVWTGGRVRSKPGVYYGSFCYDGGRVLAHRFAWFLKHGKWPESPYVCHTCDNPLCVRPSHLFQGTARDNNHDAIKKGRTVHWGRPVNSPDTVKKIRRLYATGDYTQKELASRLGLPQTQIFSAIYKWKTLQKYEQVKRQK